MTLRSSVFWGIPFEPSVKFGLHISEIFSDPMISDQDLEI